MTQLGDLLLIQIFFVHFILKRNDSNFNVLTYAEVAHFLEKTLQSDLIEQ